MSELSSYLERVEKELKRNFESHPILGCKTSEKKTIYSALFAVVAGDFRTDFALKIGTAIELIAESYKRHFEQKKPKIASELLKGDYFYARALKYTISSGSLTAVKILSRAVTREIAIRTKTNPPFYYSLVLAALELADVLKGKEIPEEPDPESCLNALMRIESDEILKLVDVKKVAQEIVNILKEGRV